MATVSDSHVDEDTVEYFLFPSTSDVEDQLEQLEELRLRCFQFLDERARSYIWHEDSMNLTVVANSGGQDLQQHSGRDGTPPHLHGKTHFGCSAEDEWYIVYLLRELSAHYVDLVIRIVDSDGEFLLVEAADHLPKWASKPENCVNRVFLHRGQVHIISIADRPSSLTPLPTGQPSIMDAVYVVRSMPHLTLAPPAIQEPIHHRIEKCASQVASSLHRTNVYVPAGVAALLKTYPALIAPAVHAFCQRDASQLQVIRAMRYFPPETRVWTSVTFTKCLYAMLVHRSFQPDKRTGWTLPPVNDAKRLTAELGMKLAVGFELLANEEATHRNAPDCLETDPRWNRFLTSLKTKGFFQDFLEGSQNFNVLMEKAREFFVNSRNADESHVSTKQPVVLRLLESVSIDTEQLKKEESSLSAPDDDSWLSVDPATLEAILEDKFGQMQVDSEKADLMPRLQTFLERSSDFEGVTPAAGTRKKSRKMSHLNPPSRKISTLSNASDMSQMSNKIGFDADSFSSAMQGILDFALPEDNWDLESESSGLSSYSEEDAADDMYSKEMDTYMDAMDRELRTTNVQQTLVDGAIRKESVVSEGGESFSDVENFQPVKIDSTALQSLLASYTMQYGRPGPASTLLAQINVPGRDKGASGNDKETDDMNPM